MVQLTCALELIDCPIPCSNPLNIKVEVYKGSISLENLVATVDLYNGLFSIPLVEEGMTESYIVRFQDYTPFAEFRAFSLIGVGYSSVCIDGNISYTEDEINPYLSQINLPLQEGYEEILFTSIGDEIHQKEIKVYPNPFTDYFTIEGVDFETMIVGLFDITGKKVMSINSNQVPTSNLSSGVYFLRAGIEVVKLIK
jgi:hypothetical protein